MSSITKPCGDIGFFTFSPHTRVLCSAISWALTAEVGGGEWVESVCTCQAEGGRASSSWLGREGASVCVSFFSYFPASCHVSHVSSRSLALAVLTAGTVVSRGGRERPGLGARSGRESGESRLCLILGDGAAQL